MSNDARFYTIDLEGAILAHATSEAADVLEDAEQFASVEELAKLIDKWPANRTLEIHNSLPLKNVTEFSSALDAAERIWKVVSKLRPPNYTPSHKEQIMKKQPKAAKESKPKKTKAEIKAERAAAKVAKKEAAAKSKAEAKAKKADAKAAKKIAKKPAKSKAPRKTKNPNAPKKGKSAGPREGSKSAKVLALLTRKEGATLGEIMKLTTWQAHTTRGWLSTLGKKSPNLTIESSKDKDGERTYKVTAK